MVAWLVAVLALVSLVAVVATKPHDQSTTVAKLQVQLAAAIHARDAATEALNTQIGLLNAQIVDLNTQVADLQTQLADALGKMPLPKLTGRMRSDATTIADQHGWIITFKHKESDKPEGTVLSQEPAAGSAMHQGAIIVLTIAKPFPPKMPNLIGKKLADAQAAADSHGWSFSKKYQVSSATPGSIVSQSPAAGTFMRGAANFTIVLAKKAPIVGSGGGSGVGSNCDPNYSGQCLEPNAIDYDCAGGSGNGPLYVYGSVQVVGVDHYGLDADHDGIGCE
jgi:hypothetical protein